jgi:CMP/dCMP kinase
MDRHSMGENGFIVAIDGPAGAGKSTMARRLAERLGLAFVDTGAIYRTVALVAMEKGIEDDEGIAGLTKSLDLSFDGPRVLLGTRDISTAIRTQDISQRASRVSAIGAVRAGLLDLQRRLARAHHKGAVLEGRDIGTVVFPDAEVKVFLTASDEERARRRALDLERAGKAEPFEVVLAAQRERDARDRQRAVAPLKPAPDAVEIDTTKKSSDEVLDEIAALVEERTR